MVQDKYVALVLIMTLFGYTFKGKQIKKEMMALIKFIDGVIMLLP